MKPKFTLTIVLEKHEIGVPATTVQSGHLVDVAANESEAVELYAALLNMAYKWRDKMDSEHIVAQPIKPLTWWEECHTEPIKPFIHVFTEPKP
jgi:hypothetical protein